MNKPVVQLDPARCRAHDICVPPCKASTACPKRLIEQETPGEPPLILASFCSACGKCITACPHQAIRIN